VDLLRQDLHVVSASQSFREVERFVNELARVPNAVRSFFVRTHAVKPGEAETLGAVREIVGGYLGQLRSTIERVEPKSTEMQRLLGLVCEAEEAIRVRHLSEDHVVASRWFYEVMGKQIGPVSSADLLALAQRGTVTYDTPIRKGPDGNWVSAKRVQGLFPAPNTTSPPMPTAASDP
jgi:hypothetical protein